MSIIVTVNGSEAQVRALTISNVITSRPDSCQLTVQDPDTAPVAGQIVQVYRDTTANMLFAGPIVSMLSKQLAPSSMEYSLICSDYQYLLDKKLVVAAYTNQTCKAIIEDIITNFTDAAIGFTTVNVDTGPTIAKIAFNYIAPSDCIRQLAEMVMYEWYVDTNKDLHFFAEETAFAPLEITDAALLSTISHFNLRPDYAQIRNKVTVRGSYTLSDPYTENQVADGEQRAFKLGYRPHALSIEEAGVPQVKGVENINEDDGTYDYMMNFMEAVVRCSEFPAKKATPPAGTVMAFTYTYERPIIVRVNDYTSQAIIAAIEGGDGVHEFIVKDTRLTSLEEARDRAQVELNTYSRPTVEGSFITREHGFQAGQTVVLSRTGDSLNGRYQIKLVQIGMVNAEPIYTVQFSSKLYDLVDYLRNLAQKQNAIEISDDELIDLLEFITDAFAVSDSVSTALQGHPVKWGPTSPQAKWSSFTWG